MSDQADNVVPHAKVRSLREAMRKVRLAEAERTDVIIELQETERARLEILCEELEGVSKEIPDGDEQFMLQVVPGNPPRMWIDVTSHVVIARDRRTYRFVKDTRLGRTVLLETDSAHAMADCITEYVAERMIDRERALESDWLLKRLRADADKAMVEAEDRRKAGLPRRGFGVAATALVFLIGLVIGIAGIVGYAWFFNPLG
ncbi:hypothetical protein C8N35_11326 [Breoghania corrubedonensis]|uniref:Uncharacterized protein n=1 Tax=Breoghania corrubedonensis TaxID=665038 RepID=A0A2T5UTZ6_9HYPH|nr:hypothetical protein [Breoghania corrubedonensis]PTW54986.1 hypothetical protein C8N35_11326 [Breoghania corrubedonensis]